VRSARKPVRDLRPAAEKLADATPQLTTVAGKLNKLFNMAAYNPDCTTTPGTCKTTLDNSGADAPGTPNRDEGYLYWFGWLGAVGNSTFANQDAISTYRNLYLTASCPAAVALLSSTPLAPLLTGFNALFVPGGPFAGALPPGACPP
jgi:hypothetical protein